MRTVPPVEVHVITKEGVEGEEEGTRERGDIWNESRTWTAGGGRGSRRENLVSTR